MYYILSMVNIESNSDFIELNKSQLDEWVEKLVVDKDSITLKGLKESARNQALIFSLKVGAGKVVSNYGGSFIGGSVAAGVAMGSPFCGVGAIVGGIGGAILASTLDHNYTKHYSYQYDFINRFLNDFPSIEEELNHNTHYIDTIDKKNKLSGVKELFYNINDKNIKEKLNEIISKSNEYAHLRLTNEAETLGTTAGTIAFSGIVSAAVGAGVGYAHLLGNTFLEPIVKRSLQGGSSNAASSLLKGRGGEVVANGAARGALLGSVFGAFPAVLDTATSAIYEHGVKPLGEAFGTIFDKVTDAVHTDSSTIYERGVEHLKYSGSEDKSEWSTGLENLQEATNFQSVDIIFKKFQDNHNGFASDFMKYLNENQRDFLDKYFAKNFIIQGQDLPNEYKFNHENAKKESEYAKDLSKVLQSFILDRSKSSFDNGNGLLYPFIDTPSSNVNIIKPTHHSMGKTVDNIDSSSELKCVNEKRIFSESANKALNKADSYVYAKAGGFIKGVLQKEVNIVRNKDNMNCLLINDCRLKNASIKIVFIENEIKLSFVNRDNTTEYINKEAIKSNNHIDEVGDILKSITINVFNLNNNAIKFTKIDESTESTTMETQETENRIRLIKEVVKPEQEITPQR